MASLLGLSSSTVETHIRTVMGKVRCHSRKHIIELINHSNEVPLEAHSLQARFLLLQLEHDFKRELQSFSKKQVNLACVIFYHDPLKQKKALLKTLKSHLSMAGISITTKSWYPGKKDPFIIKNFKKDEKKFIIYCLSIDFINKIKALEYNIEAETQETIDLLKNKDAVIFVSLDESLPTIQDYKSIQFNTESNYYSSVLLLLQLFCPLHAFYKSPTDFHAEKNPIFKSTHPKKLNLESFSPLNSTQKTFKYSLIILFIFGLLLSFIILIGLRDKFAQGNYNQTSKFAQNRSKTEMDILLNLPPRNSKFVGREKELKAISEFLNKYKFGVITQTISGLGGVGKTQLAASYIYKSLEEKLYDTILWITAETKESLNNSYIEFSKCLKIDIKGFKPTDIQRLVHEELNNSSAKNILFVLDNATPSKHIEDYINNLSKGFSNPSKLHVLITSRSQNWTQDKLLLDVFTKQEAYAFIKKYLPNETDDSIDNLAKTLHYFPLAINQAVIYIQAHTNINNYLELLKLHQDYSKALDNYSNALWSTWNLGFSKLSANAKSVLIMASYLEADQINLNYFKELTLEERDLAIAELKNHSFITINNDGNSFKIHRLLQKIVREHQGSPTHLMKVIKMLDFSFAINQDVNKGAACAALLPHVIVLAQHAIETPSLFYEGLILYIKTAMYLTYVQEDIKFADEKWSEILFLAKKHLSTEEGFLYLLANINTHFGFNHCLLGNLSIGEEVLKQAKEIYEKPLTPISTKIQMLLKDLRWTNQTSIKDGILSDYAFTLNAIANIEFDLNKLSSSEEYNKKALEIIDQCAEQKKANVYKLAYLRNLLHLYTHIKNAEGANLIEKKLNQIHAEDTSAISQSHTCERIGEWQLFQNNYEAAKNLFEKALKIKMEVYAKNNYRIGNTLSKIGLALTLMNKPKTALEYLEKAEKIYAKQFPKTNMHYLYLYFFMHYAFETDQDYKNSTEYLKQLHDMLSLSNNTNAHLLISKRLPIIDELGHFKISKRDLSYLEQSLDFINKIFGGNSLYASKYHYLLGTSFQNTSQKEKAYYHFNTALSITLNCKVTDPSLKRQNDSNISLIREKLDALKQEKG